jgi:hypothetical protein
MIRALTIVFVASLAACAADATEPSGSAPATCGLESEISPRRIAVNGVQLNGYSLNGWALNGNDINGLQLDGVDLVVGSSERAGDVTFYDLELEGRSLCAGDGDGKGVFVPGVWDDRGAWSPEGARGANATFACRSSVITKCATWGYAPSKVGSELHQACTRMARADYCGTGTPWTREGTPIDHFDPHGVVTPANEPGFLFEAGWNANGATCVSRPRYDLRDARGEAVLPSCWRDLPSCASAEEATARGAIVMNMSRRNVRTCQ